MSAAALGTDKFRDPEWCGRRVESITPSTEARLDTSGLRGIFYRLTTRFVRQSSVARQKKRPAAQRQWLVRMHLGKCTFSVQAVPQRERL